MKQLILIKTLFFCQLITSYAQEGASHRMVGQINTSYNESKPVVGSDPNVLYFTREYFPGNTKGKRDIQDIYVVRKEYGHWNESQNIGTPLNNEGANGISGISGDGNTILLIDSYSGKENANGVAIAYRKNNEWTTPQAVKILNFQNDNPYVDYSLSADGKHILMAIENAQSQGDQDIYISSKIKESLWSEPVNLGTSINTAEAEFAPFLSPDNQTLFFASYGHGSLGQSDIFFSRKEGEDWKSWSIPENMGPSVNSVDFEAYYFYPPHAKEAYFISDYRGTEGSRDIFTTPIPKELLPNIALDIVIAMVDESGNKLEEVELAIYDLDSEKREIVRTNTHGVATAKLKIKQKVIIQANTKGYMCPAQYFVVKDVFEKEKGSIKLKMYTVKLGQTMDLHAVEFNEGQVQNNLITRIHLANMKRVLFENIKVRAEIGVHTPMTGGWDEAVSEAEDRLSGLKVKMEASGILLKRLDFVPSGPEFAFVNDRKLRLLPKTIADDRIEFKITEMDWSENLLTDSDQDGIIDIRDECPQEYGTLENKGCP